MTAEFQLIGGEFTRDPSGGLIAMNTSPLRLGQGLPLFRVTLRLFDIHLQIAILESFNRDYTRRKETDASK